MIGLLAMLLFTGLVALGSWQAQRRAWKLELIERVTTRAGAPAVPAPGPARWPLIDAASDEYRRVEARGRFLPGADTFVQAVTERGAGFWVLTPLQQEDGKVLLVNRGFVTAEQRARLPPVAGTRRHVTGLLRVTEPGGGFLRRNDPVADRWYSRDVAAIAGARGLADVAPYFVDVDAASATTTAAPSTASSREPNGPVGGLTVVAFSNNHLVYAITWYTLALMVAAAAWRLMREERSAGHD